MTEIIEVLAFIVGCLVIIAVSLYAIILLIGWIAQLLGYYKVLVEAIWSIYRKRNEERSKR